jgi:hypothetical protein
MSCALCVKMQKGKLDDAFSDCEDMYAVVYTDFDNKMMCSQVSHLRVLVCAVCHVS